MADIRQALEWLWEGKKVTFQGWDIQDPDEPNVVEQIPYMYLNEDKKIMYSNGDVFNIFEFLSEGDEWKLLDDDTTQEVAENFLIAMHQIVNYWSGENRSEGKEKLKGLCHSILVLLHGNSGVFDGDIRDIVPCFDMLNMNEEFYNPTKRKIRK